jgi:hypothetical protein
LNSLMSQACKAMFQEYRSPALLTMQPSAASMQVMYRKPMVSVPYQHGTSKVCPSDGDGLKAR